MVQLSKMEDATIKKLNVNRGYIKGTLTRLFSFACNETDVKLSSLEALITKRDKLMDSFKEYEYYNKEILLLNSTDSENVSEAETKYFHCLTILNENIKLLGCSSSKSKCPEGGSSVFSRTKLPTIDIPSFSGQCSQYVTFIEIFKSVIHNDKSLDNIQKLYYLRSFLKGQPYDLIKNLPIVSGSYEEAMHLLDKRYFNKYKIISEHVNSLLELEKMPRYANANDVRNFVSVIRQTLAALKNLEVVVSAWDPILLGILTRKLDLYSARSYHLERDQDMNPTVEQFLDYLDNRALALENTDPRPEQLEAKRQSASMTAKSKVALAAAKTPMECIYCKCSDHKLFSCNKYKLLPSKDRISFANQCKLCSTCLNAHSGKCKFHFRCSQCKKDHHTLLHPEECSSANPVVLLSGHTNENMSNVLIPTARIKTFSKDGTEVHIKCVLDTGSQVSLITTKAIEVLGFTPERTDINLIGVTESQNKVSYCIPLHIHSLTSPFNTLINCHVVEKITCKLPQTHIQKQDISIPSGITLADPTFNLPSEINMLIGADVFFQVLLPLEESPHLPAYNDDLPQSSPCILNTKLGHIIAGAWTSHIIKNQVVSLLCTTCQSDVSENIKRFWEQESVPELLIEGDSEHQLTESIFINTVKLENKKFQVDLPLKLDKCKINETLGNSFDLALHRFFSLERRLQKNSNLLSDYHKFIDEFVELGHGHYIDISSYNFNDDPIYFMPHHAVINEQSKSTRIRVVFDASMKTSNKMSLNDILLNGPMVQKELFDIVLLFRVGQYTLNADIKKMFRNILVNPEHTSLQNILWRTNPNEAVRCIRLDTVIYGMKSSSYLATRCLHELAQRFEQDLPLASYIIQNCTYVDDILYSCSDLNTLLEAKKQLRQMLGYASFGLHKWASNIPGILSDIPEAEQQFTELDFEKGRVSMKALGLTLDIKKDCFTINSPVPFDNSKVTKREVLSYISRFYDPMGFASPIIIKAKSIMQRIWSLNISWDECLPKDLLGEWLEFANSLAAMQPIHLGRYVPSNNAAKMQLLGFADASSVMGYGCCIYLRVVDKTSQTKLHLLCSKSRVNPRANPLTIPRLELNAALLLSTLVKRVYETLSKSIKIDNVHLFTDSKITLAWINTNASKLMAYVSNRVSVIQQNTNRWNWLYIPSADNPADLVSRGISPQNLPNCTLWWEGPKFLQGKYKFKNESLDLPVELPELKPSAKSNSKVVLTNVTTNDFFKFLDKYSDIGKMTRVVAYILRFCHNLKGGTKVKNNVLSPNELQLALHVIIKHEQSVHFTDELKSIQMGNCVRGPLKSLHPFLDKNGLLRTGGRLENSDIPLPQKHPIILAKKSHITELIILNEHIRLLHSGPKSLLANLNQKYWLINGIRQVKKVTHKCLVCFRLKAGAAKQLMGSLPQDRVTACRPFKKVAIDFAGPVQVKNSRIRKALVTKGYVCVSVCFVTKAIHLEITSDLTTEAFLASFKRFIARRGLPSDVYCDNGGAFLGARNQLAELYKLLNSADHQTPVQAFAAKEGIKFHFTPSYSPVFAGLAEASVKSMKFHLKRIILDAQLTYEQLNTVLCQIEAILNSRPILPLSEDINDYCYLTPGHFLIGSALTMYPEIDISETKANRIGFWQQCTQLKQRFWKAWYKYYLNTMQNRSKWCKTLPNITIGALVLMRETNAPPLVWPMARVVKVFPGRDGKVRVFQLKTADGKLYTRSLQGISVLPIET